MSMYLELDRGRNPQDQQFEDYWGARGAKGPIIGPVDYVRVTYLTDLRMAAQVDHNYIETELRFDDDTLYFDGVWYGEWYVVEERTSATKDEQRRYRPLSEDMDVLGCRHKHVRSGLCSNVTAGEYEDWFRDEAWRRCSVVRNDYDWFDIEACRGAGMTIDEAIKRYVDDVRENSPSFEDADQEPDFVSTGQDGPRPD